MLKRAFDILTSSIAILVTLPLYPLIALAIKLESTGPVFYRQERIGRHRRSFWILKFRTMINGADSQRSIAIKNDNNITGVGKWLRRFEIDEMPTLINVLKGEMSVVGPRPELPRYVDSYDADQLLVLAVRPGMTDPGTLVFRNESSVLISGVNLDDTYTQQILPQKLRLNLEYVRRHNILGDLRIIFLTLRQIIRQNKG